jgi:hypothetical protein
LSQAALLLAGMALLLGLSPLVPRAGTLGLFGAALGLLPALCALGLSLASRARALRENQPLLLHTASLSASVLSSVLCGFWALSVAYFMLRR